MDSSRQNGRSRKERKAGLFEHRRTLYCFAIVVLGNARWVLLHVINTNQNLIGLVNGLAVSIHHVARWTPFCPVAFIFDECAKGMVNPRCIGRG
jgi:hypothetical protein